uniref:Stress-response A/B barrel domain-containing protein n=1 Tax=Minutocellus polymorphus TaxID=265543 RepID=A0A7S0FKK4_9STRA|mmetsp:Transcript_14456/g.24097  ORF Transcript_14456/g.24097 Transcript_14456/m.24097 type:complete len:129 (+) Transcript_14456:113-499(+)|eukprot:CAMPEP_0197734098 /NCGR_PEP_ID=MMETSP1434-20131217/44248_1 /TAXON_ID=265543 /ORGANISM="Minutocellus polymorphus, Strain CCMP3303" /LENGTH=128 /DNA_ID=CAMNT_0043321505 /DNA_START=113 /DNA_END=499 /DNA_ORIENTATION=+
MGSTLSSAAGGGGKCPMHSSSGVEHFVLLKVKADATDEQTQAMIDGVNALIGIEGVISVSIGKIFVEDWMADRTKKHNFALRVRLKNKEALRRYQEDEGHKLLLKETIVPILSELPPTAVDFESTLVM